MSSPKFPGVSIVVAGSTFVVPRLSLRQMQVLKDQLKRIQEKAKEIDLDAQIGDITDIVHAAVGRNYPDLSRDELGDLLDLGTVGPFLRAAIDGSAEETPPKGEAESLASD